MQQTHIFINHQNIFTKFYPAQNALNKQTIVFLHEALGSVAQWGDFPQLIQEKTGFNVLVYDRLGHGLSDAATNKREKDYLHHEAWHVLPSVLNHFNIQNPILWGHSDGGSIALLFGARFPTEALITEAAHIFVENITLEGIKAAVARKDFLIERLSYYHGNKTQDLWDAWANIWLQPSFRDWNIEKFLPQIKCPALIIQGENDVYGTENQIKSIVAGMDEKAKALMIPNCGHAPHKEATGIVLENSLNFLSV